MPKLRSAPRSNAYRQRYQLERCRQGKEHDSNGKQGLGVQEKPQQQSNKGKCLKTACRGLDRREAAFAARLAYGVLQNRALLDFYAERIRTGP